MIAVKKTEHTLLNDFQKLVDALAVYRGEEIPTSENPDIEHPVHFAVRMVEFHFRRQDSRGKLPRNEYPCDGEFISPWATWVKLLGYCRGHVPLMVTQAKENNPARARLEALRLMRWAEYQIETIDELRLK